MSGYLNNSSTNKIKMISGSGSNNGYYPNPFNLQFKSCDLDEELFSAMNATVDFNNIQWPDLIPIYQNYIRYDSETGLFDYDFGELILLVLVVVLIVSCALIITQKIIDYRKRLY